MLWWTAKMIKFRWLWPWSLTLVDGYYDHLCTAARSVSDRFVWLAHVCGTTCPKRSFSSHFWQTSQNATVFCFMRLRRICDSLILCAVYKCCYLLTYLRTMFYIFKRMYYPTPLVWDTYIDSPRNKSCEGDVRRGMSGVDSILDAAQQTPWELKVITARNIVFHIFKLKLHWNVGSRKATEENFGRDIGINTTILLTLSYKLAALDYMAQNSLSPQYLAYHKHWLAADDFHRPTSLRAAFQRTRTSHSPLLDLVSGTIYLFVYATLNLYTLLVVVWRSGRALVSINEVNLRRARLKLRRVTMSGFTSLCRTSVSIICNQPARSTNSAWPPLRG